MKWTILCAALGCIMLLTACGNAADTTGVKVRTDVKADADTGITYVPDSDTIRKNLEKEGYSDAPFGHTTSGGNEIIAMYRGEEPPDFSCIMIVRAETAAALLEDEEAINNIEAMRSQYHDARSYKYYNDEKYGNLYIFCTEDALADAGIIIAE